MAPGKRWMDWDYGAYGQDNPNIEGHQGLGDADNWYWGFGLQDISAAQGQGYTPQQIRILAQRAEKQGRPFGKKAQQRVDQLIAPGSMPWDYGLVGGAEFGIADLNMAIGQGADLNKIKGYTDYARQYGIGVGPEADKWIQSQEDRLQRSDLAQQARDSAAADAAKIAEATAAQTKKMEEMYARSRAVTSSSPLATGGAGSFRAKGLTTSQNKRGGGTSQFKSTNPYFQSTLNTGSGKKTTGTPTLNI